MTTIFGNDLSIEGERSYQSPSKIHQPKWYPIGRLQRGTKNKEDQSMLSPHLIITREDLDNNFATAVSYARFKEICDDLNLTKPLLEKVQMFSELYCPPSKTDRPNLRNGETFAPAAIYFSASFIIFHIFVDLDLTTGSRALYLQGTHIFSPVRPYPRPCTSSAHPSLLPVRDFSPPR